MARVGPREMKLLQNGNNTSKSASVHVIKCSLTELGRTGEENIWLLIMNHGPSATRSSVGQCNKCIYPAFHRHKDLLTEIKITKIS